jgi:hypothetical protein
MLFVSKYAEHRIILRPTDVVIDQQTRKRTVIRGLTCEFRDFKYRTQDRETIQGLIEVPEYGLTFSVGLSDKDLIDYRKKYGVMPPNGAEILLAREEKMTGIATIPPPLLELIPPLLVEPVVPAIVEPSVEAIAEGAPSEPPKPVGTNTPPDSDKIQEMIDKSVSKAMSEILVAIQGVTPKPSNPALDSARVRKSFHCKVCGQEFESGIAVGKHKKEYPDGACRNFPPPKGEPEVNQPEVIV